MSASGPRLVPAAPDGTPEPGPIERAIAWLAASGPRAYASLVALAGFLLFHRLGVRFLFNPDEGRYAEIPREMIALSDWLTPRFNYTPYFEKPPLVYWMTAGLYRLIGQSELAARLPSALFTMFTVIVTAFFGRRLLGRGAGWLGAAILATSLAPMWIGRIATLDAVLASLVILSIFAFYSALGEDPARPRRRDAWLLIGYVSGALATLVKGPVGAALPALVIAVHLVSTGRLREIWKLRPMAGAVVYLAIVAPWFVLVSRANPGFAEFFFVHETLLRYVSKVHKRSGTILYYVPILFLGLVPWSLLVPRGLYDAWRDRARPNGKAAWFLALWAGTVFVFFSLAGSKLPGYLLPAFPPLALLLGRTLLSAPGERAPAALSRDRLLRWSLAIPLGFGLAGVLVPQAWYGVRSGFLTHEMRQVCVATIFLGGLALVAMRRFRPSVVLAFLAGWVVILHPLYVRMSERMEDHYSVASLARKSALWVRPGDRLVQYRGFAEGLPFYFERRVVLYRHVGELYEGYHHLPRADRKAWFLQAEKDLAKLLAGPGRVFVVTSRQDTPEFVRTFPGVVRVTGTSRYVLFTNRPFDARSPDRAARLPGRTRAGAPGSTRARGQPGRPRLRARDPSFLSDPRSA